MNWHFCIDSAEKRALDFCYGSLTEGGGWGRGMRYGYSFSNGYGDGGTDGYGDRDGDGDGYGGGSGLQRGGGRSAKIW